MDPARIPRLCVLCGSVAVLICVPRGEPSILIACRTCRARIRMTIPDDPDAVGTIEVLVPGNSRRQPASFPGGPSRS